MASAGLSGLRMLVVEDEAMVAMVVEDMLAEIGCVVVDIAASVEQGLRLLAANDLTIDAAILDVNIGGEKVFPVAEALERRGIPFIFATGYGRAGIDPRFGDRLVIAKPFQLKTLASSLSSAVS